jgi:hypothetical protein
MLTVLQKCNRVWLWYSIPTVLYLRPGLIADVLITLGIWVYTASREVVVALGAFGVEGKWGRVDALAVTVLFTGGTQRGLHCYLGGLNTTVSKLRST